MGEIFSCLFIVLCLICQALEIVKDELGINPEHTAIDPNYKLDLELLPFLKQKQLLNYLRILVAFQRKKQEEGYKPCLIQNREGKR